MKIRLMGLPGELARALKALHDADGLDVTEVSSPYPNRGDSRLARIYIDARLRADGRADP